jgi:uncharacterized protein YeeX (DUF496 family)
MSEFLKKDSIEQARIIVEAPEDWVWECFFMLRREKRLSRFVSDMNSSLRDLKRRELALAALRRLGLEYAG